MPTPTESHVRTRIQSLIERATQIQSAVKTRPSQNVRHLNGEPELIHEYPEEECLRWRSNFTTIGEMVVSRESTHWNRFQHILSYGDPGYLIKDGKAFLIAILDDMEHRLLAPAQPQASHSVGNAVAIQTIERIAHRFNEVVKRMRHRHEGRPTLDAADEYDVQDLLHSLLLVSFDDVRAEEWTPSTAGATSRMDLVLKAHRIVIETKMMRKGLTDRKLTEELLIDLGLYPAHPDCGYLVMFIFDPEERIGNPAALRDIETRGSVPVKVLVSPRR